MKRKVEVVPYNSEWPAMFKAEKARIVPVFGDRLLSIHHIGSTSVPGLAAKPIIDMMPVVKDILAVDECNSGMEGLGYTAMGEYGIPGRRLFSLKIDDITNKVHIHVFQHGDLNIERHLAFRDYLRAFPSIADEYVRIKRELAQRFTWDIEAYMDGKNGFIKETEREAINWYRKKTGSEEQLS